MDTYEQADREHRDYLRLLTEVQTADRDTFMAVARKVRLFITNPHQGNLVYADSLLSHLTRQAFEVQWSLNDEPQTFYRIKVREITRTMRETYAVSPWETMVNNGPNEG